MSEVIRELGEHLQATKHSNGGAYNQATDSICLAILAEDVLSRLPEPVEEAEAAEETPEPEKKPAPKKAARSGAKKK